VVAPKCEREPSQAHGKKIAVRSGRGEGEGEVRSYDPRNEEGGANKAE
jgi:hypothetical protein